MMSVSYCDDTRDLLQGLMPPRKWKVTFYSSVKDLKPKRRTVSSLDDLLDLLEPVLVDQKEDAPVVGFYQSDGLREHAAVVQAHALVYDLDGTDPEAELTEYLEAHDIEALPFVHLYWESISSTEGNRRWRLVIPLEHPLDGKWYEAVSGRVLAWLRERWPNTVIDDCSKRPSQPWFVPCYREGQRPPHPVLNEDGLGLLSVTDILADAMQAGESRKYKRKYKSFKRGSRAAQVPVFVPDPTIGEHVTLDAKTPLVVAQHACAYLQRHGIRVAKGSRQPVLNFMLWHLFRAGRTIDQLDVWVTEAVERSGEDTAYLGAKLEGLLLHYEGLEVEAQPWYQALASACGQVWEKYRFQAYHAARILSRHQGMRTERGTAINLREVGELVGLTAQALTKIIGLWEQAGVYARTGSGRGRKHRIILPTIKETTS